jgi:hypothetical protein
MMVTGLHRPATPEHNMGRITAVADRTSQAEQRTDGETHYLWAFPGSPVKVRLDLAVASAIAARIQQNTGDRGLLLGRASSQITEIQESQPLPPGETGVIEPILANAAKLTGEPYLVGFYRTHDGDSLRLTDQDYALAETYFTAPYCVFLVIRPGGSETPTATFFFRDERGMNGDFAFLEFPFDANLLAAAQRRKGETGRLKAVAPAAAPSLPAIVAPVERPRRSRFWRRAAWTLFFLALAGAGAYTGLRFWPLKISWPAVLTPPTAGNASSFGLRAERQNGDVKLTWNRESPAITGAVSGALTIHDGDSTRELALDASQVRDGSVLYQPLNDQVRMQLTVLGASGSISEAVLVILPPRGSPQTQAPPPNGGAPPQTRVAPQPARTAPLRPFAPPPDRVSPGQSPAIVEPPPAAAPTLAPAAPAVLSRAPGSILRVPPPLMQEEPTATRGVVVTSYRPPALIQEAMPVIPQIMRAALIAPKTVEVRVSLDERGKVTKAEADRRPDVQRLMADAAEIAARQCRYKPATNGGKPVAGEIILRFQFKPQR